MHYAITVVLLLCSALFSGLTLGLMSLDVYTLRRKARLGNVEAVRILPIRERGNQLLTTLLLGNVAVNALIAVFLGSLVSGLVATLATTGLVLVFGEILPMAIISRHAMSFGAALAPCVRFLMVVSSPITYPIGWILDRALGEQLPTLYTKRELMEIISEHEDSEHSTIDRDEERIVHGALQFSHTHVREVMTHKRTVQTLSPRDILNNDLRERLADLAYSRYPVVDKDPERVVGILYTKDLLNADEDEQMGEVCERGYLRARPDETLDAVLARMLTRSQHMAIVRDDDHPFLGVLTLEDIIEEIIQQEIRDEDDEGEE